MVGAQNHTIHLLPSLEEVFWIRESDKAVLGLEGKDEKSSRP
jgi:hypothetical protein